MTPYDPDRHHRRSIRLKGYDYTQPGAYFIPICAHERASLFGAVVGGEMVLNEYGRIVQTCWDAIPNHFPHAELDAFVVMQNHVHGMLWIVETDGARNRVRATHAWPLPRNARPSGPASGALGAIVGSFKSAVTRRINALRGTPGPPVWQRNYHQHILRNEGALNTIRRYIAENPLRWHLDRYNAATVGPAPPGPRPTW
ncbi:MAG: transposase [bacterium]|jgi:REP element-mobilizing transposase RayT|nr:transposase [candidate division KSB1 bacterium]MDH7559885.1 transposase [bacterium]